MADINLLGNENHKFRLADVGVSVVVKVLGGLLVLLLLYYGYLWWSARQVADDLTNTQNKIAAAQKEAINNKDRAELITRQGQLTELGRLIQNHLSWSYLLPELARVTIRSSTYTTVEADATGKLSLEITAPSYADLDKYLQIFDLPQYNAQFSDVKVLAINKDQQGSSLQSKMKVELKFNPDFIRNLVNNGGRPSK